MKNEFVPYDIALAMKELGFDEKCYSFYNELDNGEPTEATYKNGKTFIGTNHCLAPLYQQAFRWFREEYDIMPRIDRLKNKSYFFEWREGDNKLKLSEPDVVFFENYEEAQKACIRKLIQIVKDKQTTK